MNGNEKIEPAHLKQKAILYIRQSTMRQVHENTESTLRQYALKDRLISLGWAHDMIEVIDCDLGRSGTEAAGRSGFRRMLADVGEGNVGAIACIECSRLSRHSGDWGRLMEICALGGTMLIDDDGIYDPNDFNDRLLLGLKGTMSEAELHFLQGRMRGGALSKASRGELRSSLPTGYIYSEDKRIVKDPDRQVQKAIEMFFESFQICGTAHKVAAFYGEKGYLFPTDRNRGFGNSTDIHWDALSPSRAQNILRSPVYAGVYAYGRIQTQNTSKGKKRRPVTEDKIISFIENNHEAYITLDEYRANCDALSSNNTRSGASAPRSGMALLQGIAVCAKCGSRLAVNYKKDKDNAYWQYVCTGIRKGEPFSHKHCICISGRAADQAVAGIVLRKLTPEAIMAANEVRQELDDRRAGEEQHFVMRMEKSKYESELARKRYMHADPENRLVAGELERLWNEKMRGLAKTMDDLQRYKTSAKPELAKPDIEQLLCLPEKLQNAWNNSNLGISDKKRILRCFIEDIAFNVHGDDIQLGIRFKGGATESVRVRRPLRKYETWTTDPEIVEYIRDASKKHTVEEMVEHLNAQGKKSGKGLNFTLAGIRGIQYSYKIPSFKEHLRLIGYLSTEDKAKQMGISPNALNKRRVNGTYQGLCFKTTGGGDYMYAP